MNYFRKSLIICLILVFYTTNTICQKKANSVRVSEKRTEKLKKKRKRNKKVKLPSIDLSHWSITIPKGNNGKAISVEPPEILNYATNETLKPFMYNDSIRGSLDFYVYPSDATTANTKYSRSELREQMVSGENNKNWKFSDGAYLKGKLAVRDVSRYQNGKYHKVIIMQIHGRLTDKQRDLIGQKDNNAPPILKIYWQNGKIRVKTKELKNLKASDLEILNKNAWRDDEGFNFEQKVGFRKFTLEVKASDGKLVIVLNNSEYKVYKNISLKRWGIFENYFKAGNYFQSRDKGAFARVSYYELSVSH